MSDNRGARIFCACNDRSLAILQQKSTIHFRDPTERERAITAAKKKWDDATHTLEELGAI